MVHDVAKERLVAELRRKVPNTRQKRIKGARGFHKGLWVDSASR